MDIISAEGIGMVCPESGIKIYFEDEHITDYLCDTFVQSVILDRFPDSDQIDCTSFHREHWLPFYEASQANAEQQCMSLDELMVEFKGDYKAIEVSDGHILSNADNYNPIH